MSSRTGPAKVRRAGQRFARLVGGRHRGDRLDGWLPEPGSQQRLVAPGGITGTGNFNVIRRNVITGGAISLAGIGNGLLHNDLNVQPLARSPFGPSTPTAPAL
ncbi:MAG: hypothetical protein ACXVVQ_17170 [Solirubrobacteraceae bacterium]